MRYRHLIENSNQRVVHLKLVVAAFIKIPLAFRIQTNRQPHDRRTFSGQAMDGVVRGRHIDRRGIRLYIFTVFT